MTLRELPAEEQILIAWRKYQRTEKYGLAFGRVRYELQQQFKAKGFRVEGEGVCAILHKLKIPRRTAYYWINRYRESIGLMGSAARIKRTAGPLPLGTYRVIYADPPWSYGGGCFAKERIGGGAEHHYPTMPLDELCQMPLPNIAADAVLFLWATAPLIRDAFQVLDAWGFQYATNIVWDKVKHNMGHYTSVRHEHLLIATRGTCLPTGQHVDQGGVERIELVDSVQSIERTEHSRKPERFREIIDRMYPTGPRIELFARGQLPAHWAGWGDQYEGAAA